jgi:predicted nuclease of predicted toxin-antitoxin system
MRFLLDQGLPRSAATYLRQAGHDAVHVSEIGFERAADIMILKHAESDKRVVVTLDADFHMILGLEKLSGPSVIRIRKEGLKGQQIAECITSVFCRCAAEIERGAIVSVMPPYIRVKLLPLP